MRSITSIMYFETEKHNGYKITLSDSNNIIIGIQNHDTIKNYQTEGFSFDKDVKKNFGIDININNLDFFSKGNIVLLNSRWSKIDEFTSLSKVTDSDCESICSTDTNSDCESEYDWCDHFDVDYLDKLNTNYIEEEAIVLETNNGNIVIKCWNERNCVSNFSRTMTVKWQDNTFEAIDL